MDAEDSVMVDVQQSGSTAVVNSSSGEERRCEVCPVERGGEEGRGESAELANVSSVASGLQGSCAKVL